MSRFSASKFSRRTFAVTTPTNLAHRASVQDLALDQGRDQVEAYAAPRVLAVVFPDSAAEEPALPVEAAPVRAARADRDLDLTDPN